ncbi:hypothetical protein [Gemmatimonas sp.]|uniref:hypothetical protein n=1 Tax=Gemmatimonas sp. TaxID=1962908 RepID=UPI003565B575
MVINGKVILDGGEFLGLDEADLFDAAARHICCSLEWVRPSSRTSSGHGGTECQLHE